jgi:hypothetical protein
LWGIAERKLVPPPKANTAVAAGAEPARATGRDRNAAAKKSVQAKKPGKNGSATKGARSKSKSKRRR